LERENLRVSITSSEEQSAPEEKECATEGSNGKEREYFGDQEGGRGEAYPERDPRGVRGFPTSERKDNPKTTQRRKKGRSRGETG